MSRKSSRSVRKRQALVKPTELTFRSIVRRHPVAFAILYLPAVIAIIAASKIGPFVGFYLLFPGVWCFFVSAAILHDIDCGTMRFRATGWSTTITRDKSPLRFWGTIAIWAMAYLFAIAFPIGYALQERAETLDQVEQGTAP